MKKVVLALFVLALMVGGAWADPPVITSGWNAFVIREGVSGPPLILDNDVYALDAVEMVVYESGQKAGLGTNDLNGALISQMGELHIDRLDDPLNSGSLYGPYFNIWVTDGLGNYAVLSNEPSDAEWAADRWYSPGWDTLKTRRCKVYETPNVGSSGAPGTSWVATYAQGQGWDGVSPLTFEFVGGLIVEPPSAAYITNTANAVGSGAPDELGTNVAYGYNWIFGDTLANYVTGMEGFVVNNYYVTVDFPVHNVTLGIDYGNIHAAVADAVDGNAITVDEGVYVLPSQLVIDKDISLTGLGNCSIVPGFNTGGASYSTTLALIYVDYDVTATISGFDIDGSGWTCHTGIQSRGALLTVSDCEISNMYASTYDGRGLVFLKGAGVVEDCIIHDTQRIGIHVRGAIEATDPYVDIDNLTFTGKGPGDWLDYGVEFGGGGSGTVSNSSISGCVGVAVSDGSTSAGILVTDYYGTGTTADIDGCTLTGNYAGLTVGYAETDGSVVTIHNSDLGGNTDYGIASTGPVVDATDNDWGDASGPYHPAHNPNGLGDRADDFIEFVPWTGRTPSVLAVGSTPTGALYWEGTPAIGVDDDSAPGFDPGAFQAPNDYTRYGFDADTVFGREVLFGELYKISYHTKKGTTHVADAADWYFLLYTKPYTGSPGSSWYGNRIGSEPYFSADLNDPVDTWNLWQTDDGIDNRLRFFDSSSSYFGGYGDPFLQDITADPDYATQPIMWAGLSLGTAWAAGFDGLLDGFTVELYSGETFTINFLSGNAQVAATPAASGPINCSESQYVTFGVELTDDMPDLFLYNAVVRATGEVAFGAVEDLYPFGTVNNNFFALDNGDGSWTITGSTVGNPSYPVTAPGTADLFKIRFDAVTDGVADITFDSLVLRDPDNNPIPALTAGATIEVDCTAPAAVTGITAETAHNRIDVSWTHDGTDVAYYEVYRGLWYDTDIGVSAYPEYDDETGETQPTRPANRTEAWDSDEWVLAETVAVGTNILADVDFTDATRGVYYYEVFPVDAAGNPAPVAAANDRATSYWLGDLDSSPGDAGPDGLVDPFDMNVLGAAFGESDGDGFYDNEADVGPTDDWSRLGIPTTDSVINFEDLMVFAMNFGVVSDAKADVPIGSAVDLVWVTYDDGTMGLRLEGGQGLKGVRVTADAAVYDVRAGDLLDQQSELTFLRNVGSKLDVSVAVMGVNTTFEGTGDLFVLASDAEITMKNLAITARALDNSELKISLSAGSDAATPRVFALNANYPNPFNPMTKISFSLPESRDVRLSVYGIDGRLVRTLVNETRGPGLHEVIWNGQDDSGRGVASGTYFYRIEAGPYSDVKKMTLMK